MELLSKFLVLGLPVHLHDNYHEWVKQRLLEQQGTHIVTINAEMAMQAQKDAKLTAIINDADLVIPDGAGVVLFLRSQRQSIDRCPGIELSEHLVQTAAAQNWRVFLIGGAEGVADTVAAQWQQRFPDLAIAGTQHGYFQQTEEELICDRLQATQPDLILVGLGVPRQEYWIHKYRHLCPQATWIGVGGSLDIWAGVKTRAPRWLRENNLEWVYRLYKEPWRWRRMLALPHFAWSVVLQLIRQRLAFSN